MRDRLPTTTFWDWLNLYWTGILLVVLLLGHLAVVHLAAPAPITAASVWERLRMPAIWVLDLGLLSLGLYHGLVGLRRVILDLEVLGRRGALILTLVFAAFGVLAAAAGVEILRAFAAVR